MSRKLETVELKHYWTFADFHVRCFLSERQFYLPLLRRRSYEYAKLLGCSQETRKGQERQVSSACSKIANHFEEQVSDLSFSTLIFIFSGMEMFSFYRSVWLYWLVFMNRDQRQSLQPFVLHFSESVVQGWHPFKRKQKLGRRRSKNILSIMLLVCLWTFRKRMGKELERQDSTFREEFLIATIFCHLGCSVCLLSLSFLIFCWFFYY